MKLKTSGLFATWLVTRAWLFLTGIQLLPYKYGDILWADVRLYDWWAGNIQHGHFPINDPMWQYPPLAAFIFLVGYLLAPLTIGFVFLALAFDALTFYFLYEAGTNSGKKDLFPTAVWVSAAPLMGPVMIGRFDVFPTFFAVAALVFIGNKKFFGINVAIGTFLKVWPVLLFASIKRKDLKQAVTWFLVACVTLWTSLSLWWPDSFAFVSGQKSRGLQIESVGALPYMAWHTFISPLVIDLRYGAIEVIAPGIGLTSAIITLIALALFGQLLYWRLKGLLDHVESADIAAYVVAVSMVTSRVLSPQYILWLFGLLAVCAIKPMKSFTTVYGLIALSAFLGQLLYPILYNGFMTGTALSFAVQTVRLIALVAATYLMWRNIRNQLSESGSLPESIA